MAASADLLLSYQQQLDELERPLPHVRRALKQRHSSFRVPLALPGGLNPVSMQQELAKPVPD
jgi:hypothetical protein